MKKFILEKNFSTGMTVHPPPPLLPPPPPLSTSSLVNNNSPQSSKSSSFSSPSTTPSSITTKITTSVSSSSSLSPNIVTTNGYTNSSTTHKSNRGVNSNQLIHPSAGNPINQIGNHNDSGFQPYRGSVPTNLTSSLEDGLINSVQQQQQQSSSGPSSDNPVASSSSSTSATTTSNLANMLPYSERLRSAAVAAGYSYNPFIGPPSHSNQPSSMPQPSQPSPHHNLSTHPLPPQAYRIDDPIYLERYGLIRSSSNNISSTVQSLSHSDLSPGHTSTNSNVPSYQMSSRYSELLATHQERVLNEEKQRLLGHGSNNPNHHPSTHQHQHQHQQHPPVSSSGPTNYKIHSVSSDPGPRARDYPNNDNIPGREVNTSSNSKQKHQLNNGTVTISNPGSRPMNLTANATSVNQMHKTKNNTNAILIDLKKEYPQQSMTYQPFGPPSVSQTTITFTNNPVTTTSSNVNNHLWRPQISDRDDSRHHMNSMHHHSRMFPDNNIKRNVAFEVPIDYSNSKKQRFSDLPNDFSLKSSPSIEHQPEPFISGNHSSSLFINSLPDLQVQLLKSRPQSSTLSSSQAPQQLQQQQKQSSLSPPPPLRQINYNNNTTQSKKFTISEVGPQSRQPSKSHQAPQQPQIQPHKDHVSQKNDENVERVISKLDLMEMKLKLKRKERADRAASRGSVETSEDEDDLIYSEEETSDEEENELKKARLRCKYMITTGPPAKLDARPEKVDFLSSLGLITLQRRNEILFEKYVSRRRFKSESDANVLVSALKVPKPDLFDSENVFIQPTDILPNSLFKSEDKLEDKFNYMNLLGLKHELNADEIKKREQIWEGVLEERDRRRSINLSYGKITNNLTKEALDKWFQYLTSQPRIYNNHDCYNKNGYFNNTTTFNCNHKTSATKTTPKPTTTATTTTTGSSFNTSTPPSYESNYVPLAPVNNSWHSQRRTLNVTSDRKQSKQPKTIFKQQGLLKSIDNREILLSHNKSPKSLNSDDKKKHNLPSSSSARLNNNNHNSSTKFKADNLQIADPDGLESEKDSEASSHYNDKQTTSIGFKWPGIEALTSAYENYALESQKEKESLNGKLFQLKSTIRERTNAVDKLSKKLANLTKVQKEMDKEIEKHERQISSIKTTLNEIVS